MQLIPVQELSTQMINDYNRYDGNGQVYRFGDVEWTIEEVVQ